MIKGITVTLINKTESGRDAFNAPIYTETTTDVKNVLVTPVDSTDLIDGTDPDGKRLSLELCLPKGDSNNWTDADVIIRSERFKVMGVPREWIEENVPLLWNKKVRVVRYE